MIIFWNKNTQKFCNKSLLVGFFGPLECYMQLLILSLGGFLVISKQWMLKQVISSVYSIHFYSGIQSIERTSSGNKDTQPTFKAWWNIVFGNYVYKQCWQTQGLVWLIPELDVSITCQQKIIIKTAFDPSMHIFPVNDFHRFHTALWTFAKHYTWQVG